MMSFGLGALAINVRVRSRSRADEGGVSAILVGNDGRKLYQLLLQFGKRGRPT